MVEIQLLRWHGCDIYAENCLTETDKLYAHEAVSCLIIDISRRLNDVESKQRRFEYDLTFYQGARRHYLLLLALVRIRQHSRKTSIKK